MKVSISLVPFQNETVGFQNLRNKAALSQCLISSFFPCDWQFGGLNLILTWHCARAEQSSNNSLCKIDCFSPVLRTLITLSSYCPRLRKGSSCQNNPTLRPVWAVLYVPSLNTMTRRSLCLAQMYLSLLICLFWTDVWRFPSLLFVLTKNWVRYIKC